MTKIIALAYLLSGMTLGMVWEDFKNDDSMRHLWIVEHMDCRVTDVTREILGVTEIKWTCRKQDAFWRPNED